jgi:hypothetical protein
MPKNPTTTLKVWTRNDDARNCHLYVDADAAVLKVIMDGAKDRQTLDDRMIRKAADKLTTLFNDPSWKPTNACTTAICGTLDPSIAPQHKDGSVAQRDSDQLMTKMNTLRALYTVVIKKFESSGRGIGGSDEAEKMSIFLSPGYWPYGPKDGKPRPDINPGHDERVILTYMHYLYDGKPAADWGTRLNPTNMRDHEDFFDEGGASDEADGSNRRLSLVGPTAAAAAAAPHPTTAPITDAVYSVPDGFDQARVYDDEAAEAAGAAEAKPQTDAKPAKKMTEEAARKRMVEIAEQEASEAKINASRAIYLSIPTNELSADQQSKRQRLIASIEADLGLQ